MAARNVLLQVVLISLAIECSSKSAVTEFPAALFPIHPLNTSVNHGEPVILDCVVDLELRSCYWKRYPSFKNHSVKSITPNRTPGYTLVGRKKDGECSMKIEKASITEDDGVWECHVTTEKYGLVKSISAGLIVQKPPEEVYLSRGSSERIDSSENVSLSLSEGSDINFGCTATQSNPAAEITWLVDFNEISSYCDNAVRDPENGYTFTKRCSPNTNVTMDYHQKIIRCQIHHPAISHPLEKHFLLLVEHPTTHVEIRPDKWNTAGGTQKVQNVTVHVGHPEFIECEANGYPAPTFTWMKYDSEGKIFPVYNGQKLRVGASIEDEGIYKCLAENSNNKGIIPSSHNICVIIEYATSNVTVLPSSQGPLDAGSTLTLTCRANGFPAPEIRWFRRTDDQLIPISGGTKLIMSNITFADQGHYYCLAFNTHNSKEIASDAVHLKLKGAVTSSSKSSRWTPFLLHNLYIYLVVEFLYIFYLFL